MPLTCLAAECILCNPLTEVQLFSASSFMELYFCHLDKLLDIGPIIGIHVFSLVHVLLTGKLYIVLSVLIEGRSGLDSQADHSFSRIRQWLAYVLECKLFEQRVSIFSVVFNIISQ